MAKKGKGINIFQHVPKATPARTQFPIYHKCDFDADFGYGYPVFCQEVIPGDTWHISADHFARLAPMIAPVFHDFDVKFHWFFVPMRLLWDDFEDWMTGGRTGTWREDNPDSFPVFNLETIGQSTENVIGTVFDFLGINFSSDGTGVHQSLLAPIKLPVMPVRGYWMIYNYFFRDQNVVEELDIPLTSGLDDLSWAYQYAADNLMFRVSWDKDYFTSATLSPQRGPEVFIPLLGNGVIDIQGSQLNPVQGTIGNTSNSTNLEAAYSIQGDNLKYAQVLDKTGVLVGSESGVTVKVDANNFGVRPTEVAANLSGHVDMETAPGAAVDDVREAFALQRFFERMQLVGSRFAEFLRGIWGTNAGDARLQMPEYLGTWRNPFMINNVSNTTGTANNPQGGYAGNGMASQYNAPIHKNFPEYGYIYCIYSALPRNGYQQGLAPIFCRKEWLDFANPYFEHIGEQPIAIKELYFDPSKTEAENEETFGYQSQYASYKFINSHSHGAFKESLNFWHANRIFDSRPSLSREFIEYDGDESTNRDFVLTDEPKIYTTIQFDGYVERNLSAFSTPRLL